MLSFNQRLSRILQSAALVAVSIIATITCLSLGTFATTRTVDWARGVKKGTTYNQLKLVVTNERFIDTVTDPIFVDAVTALVRACMNR